MFTKFLIVVLALVGAAAGTVSSASPAAAASYTNKEIPGAYGSLYNIYWPVDTAYEVYFDVKIEDTAADGDHAEARVQSKTPGGAVTSYSWHSASGYGTENRFSTYIKDDTVVAAVRIQVCRKGDDLPDICGYSPWVYQQW